MIRSAFLVTMGSIASLLAGIASQVVIAWYFGTGSAMDAFLTAFVIPGYLQAILLTGLSFVLIPVFVQEREAGRGTDAWAMVGTFVRIMGIGMTVLALAGSLSARSIIRKSAPGLSPEASQMAGRMLSVLIFNLPLAALISISAGIQNANGRFFWPAVAPALGSIANVAVVSAGYRPFGPMALAWGSLCSTVVQASVTFGPVARHGWPRVLSLKDARIVRAIRLLSPIILFGLFGRAVPVLERYFASGLPGGSISYLGYAGRITTIVQALLGTGIITAIFPDMVRESAIRGVEGAVEQYRKALRFTLVIALPAVTLLSVLALPLVQTVFERGRFTATSAAFTAAALPFLMGTVFCNILGDVVGRTLYARGRTFWFNLAGAFAILFYPILAVITIPGMGYRGLAFSSLVVNLLGLSIGRFLLWRELGHIHNKFVPRYILCALAAGLVCFAVIQPGIIRSSPLLALILGGGAGLIVYALCLILVDREAVTEFWRRIVDKMRMSSPFDHPTGK